MKQPWKMLILFALTLGCLVSLCAIGAGAAEPTVVPIAASAAVPLSPALHVLAGATDMRVATLVGNDYAFSKQDFARAMNLSSPEYITITKLPDPVEGALYVGSDGVVTGQTLRAADLSLLTYEPATDGVGQGSFSFTVNGSAYEIECIVYTLASINASPSTAAVPAQSGKLQVYANTPACGVLGGYDPEGDALTFEIVTYPQNGLLQVTDQATGAYTYVPGRDYVGADAFTYVLRDCYGNYSAAGTVSISVQTCTLSRSFDDLAGKDCETAAMRMCELGLMSGTQKGSLYCFEPERGVSRVDFLVTAMNAVGMRCESVASTGFADDADIPDAMKGYVKTAYEKGYVDAVSEKGELYFKPNETLTRGEAAVILSNLIGYANQKVPTNFTDTVPTFAEDALVSLYSLGILQTPDGSVQASATLTRSDLAMWLAKTISLIKGN